jgi:hypothetical protein
MVSHVTGFGLRAPADDPDGVLMKHSVPDLRGRDQ